MPNKYCMGLYKRSPSTISLILNFSVSDNSSRVDNQFAGYTDILASTTYKMTTWSNRYELSATFSVLIFIIVGTFTLINMRLSGSFKEVD